MSYKAGDKVKVKVGAAIYDVLVFAVITNGILGSQAGVGMWPGEGGSFQTYFYPDASIQRPKAEPGVFYKNAAGATYVGQADGRVRYVYCEMGKASASVITQEFDPSKFIKQA